MRIRRSHLLFLAVLAVSALSWYVGAVELEPRLASLASQPHVKTAFVDPDTGTSDALMALISFSLLAPLAVFVAIMVILFVVKFVKTAFVDPDTGTSDALMALISFSLLAPLAVFVAIMVILFVVKFVETILVSAHAPGWPSTPLVGIALVATLYTTSPTWIPTSLYTLGLVARAYFVYRYGGAVPGVH